MATIKDLRAARRMLLEVEVAFLTERGWQYSCGRWRHNVHPLAYYGPVDRESALRCTIAEEEARDFRRE
jgi:hypothetical protein